MRLPHPAAAPSAAKRRGKRVLVLRAAGFSALLADDHFRSLGQPLAADQYLDVLCKSRKPLIITGPALMNARGRERMLKLEEASGIPVIGMESPRGINDPSLGPFETILTTRVDGSNIRTVTQGAQPAWRPHR